MKRANLLKRLNLISRLSFYEFNRSVRRVPFCYQDVHEPLCNWVQKKWEEHLTRGVGQTRIRIIIPRA